MVPRHTSRSIDVIRGLAALGVIWGHSVSGIRLLDLNGAFWVWVFLPISGYLVARGFSADGYGASWPGYGRFLWNRTLRIVPLAELALLVGLLFVLASGAAVPLTAGRQFLFVPPDNDMSIVGPLWTVAAEMQFYVVSIALVPVFRAAWRRVGPPAVIALWVLVALTTGSRGQPRTLAGNLAFFTFGILLALPEGAPVRVGRGAKVATIVLLIGIAWWLQTFRPDDFWGWGQHDTWPLGGAAVCALLISAIVVLVTPRAHEAGARWHRGFGGAIVGALAWCGFYTYGIYVYHSVLATLNNAVLHVPPGAARLAVLAAAVAIAPLSHRWFERPILRFKVARGGAPRAAAAAEATQVPGTSPYGI
jgi:peptidoglycan/LPS O-acetylase OafA/YrhL